jgi:hypothetical protein
MTCEQLEERLSDWLEHDVDAATRAALERHAAGCARCSTLVADFAAIRREAAALPPLVPSRDLWPEIEARIQAPVISLDQPRRTRPAVDRGAGRRGWWMGAAAAGLVAVSAGVTYYLSAPDTPAPTMAVSPAIVRSPDSAAPAQITEPPAALASGMESGATRADGRPPSSAPASSEAGEGSEYDRDVAQLRAIVRQRRTEFDSTTIAVLEKNLELIDRAIAESRAALQRDPASEFLADQLARAMTKKVAILRTVALLPARS